MPSNPIPPTGTAESGTLAPNERVVRDADGRLQIERLSDPDFDIPGVLASLEKAIPYLPDHIDGEFDLALSAVKRLLISPAASPPEQQGKATPEIASELEAARQRVRPLAQEALAANTFTGKTKMALDQQQTFTELVNEVNDLREENARLKSEQQGAVEPAKCLHHCDHDNGVMYNSNPPQWDVTCCRCGRVERRHAKDPQGKVTVHSGREV